MKSSLEGIIILDIIVERASDERVSQLCSGLTNTYHSQSVGANTPDTFGWGSGGGTSGNVKIAAGAAEFLVEYDNGNQRVLAIGACGSTNLDHFSVSGGDTLQYSYGGFSFTVQCKLIDNSSIQITLTPGSSATVTAKD